jgi:hypothetical protein
MRPLNRPMFKYGGPIKEGIMDGMKEPQAINTVGSPLAPRDASGRQQYAIPLLGFLGVNALRTAAMRAVPKIANLFRTQVGTKMVPKQGPVGIGPVKVTRGPGGTVTRSSTQVTPGMGEASIFAPSYLGRDPTVKLIGGIGKAVTSPTAKGIGGKAAQFVFSPTGIVAGAYYANGKYFNKDGKEIPEEIVQEQGLTTGRQFTGDEAMVGDPRQPLPDSKPKPTQKDLTKSRIEATKKRYYELMGVDKMKKDALYDSLLDASNIVQEEGADLKGALKSGTLQNRIINAISKNLDKSSDIKRQIDAAVLKGEIDKDVAGSKPGSYLKQAEDYAAMKKVSVSQAYKDLGFDKRGDLNEGVQLYLKTNKVAPAGNDLATLARSYEIDIAGIEDTTTVKNKIKEKGYDEVGYLTEILSNPNANVKPGNYVINNRVLNVDADKNITPVF